MIIDLHCDLLGCCATNPQNHFDSPQTNCSISQLLQGGVKLQTFALATITSPQCQAIGMRQVELYSELIKEGRVGSFKAAQFNAKKLHGIIAIENASTLLGEEEALDFFFTRWEKITEIEEILYISLTWNQENRFGGGNHSTIGIKEDGKRVLDFIDGKNVAIDLSHTSDTLAHDILTHISQNCLNIPVIASHSNYRAICDIPRNLPDELCQEIFIRNGLIGFNLIRRFIGEDTQSKNHLIDMHIEHALKLGGLHHIALGSDFYGEFKMDPSACPERTFPTFLPEFSDASKLPALIEHIENSFGKDLSNKLAHDNVLNYLRKWKNFAANA